MTESRAWADITDPADPKDIADPADAADATEKIDPADPIEPIEAKDPIEPIESTDPFEAIERTESSDQSDMDPPSITAPGRPRRSGKRARGGPRPNPPPAP